MSIEFDAEVEKGTIAIPKEQKKRLGRHKRVHVTISAATAVGGGRPRKNILEALLKNPIRVPKVEPLKRDEIYAGRCQ